MTRDTLIRLMKPTNTWRICVDTGGTFTDCIALDPHGARHEAKVLSSAALPIRVNCSSDLRTLHVHEADAATLQLARGVALRLRIRGDELLITGDAWQVCHSEGHPSIELHQPIPAADRISAQLEPGCSPVIVAAHLVTKTPFSESLPPIDLRLATTRGTNALLTRSIARSALFVTAGFEDLLAIGNQQRPDLFSRCIERPCPLPEFIVGVHGRVDAEGAEICSLGLQQLHDAASEAVDAGCTSASVALLNSYRNPEHEHAVARVLREAGFETVSLSSELAPMIGYLARAETAAVEAAVGPIVEQYLAEVRTAHHGENLHVMTSAGGLVSHRQFRAVDGLLSGPAGGVTGAAAIGQRLGLEHIISFDMGGTSTDVARFDGEFTYQFSHRVGDATLLRPALAIETVAAGGGSICGYADGRVFVGPSSAGADPGPACYGLGGPLTLTDVNLLAGRVDASQFTIPTDVDAAAQRAAELQEQVSTDTGQAVDVDDLIDGWIDIANQRMANAIEQVSIRRGFDLSDAAMIAFGGAGGQHACAVAQRLGITTVVCPNQASLLSAVGLQESRIERFIERQVLMEIDDAALDFDHMMQVMQDEAATAVESEGVGRSDVAIVRRIAQVRLLGQESTVAVECHSLEGIRNEFVRVYQDRYGYAPPADRSIEIESVRVVASTSRPPVKVLDTPAQVRHISSSATRPCRSGGSWHDVPRFDRSDGERGDCVDGPALISEQMSMIVVEAGWRARWWEDSHIVLEHLGGSASDALDSQRPEAVAIELFTHQLTTIATDMGEMLQRTAMSTNIKERLDFSCALLDEHGELLVNAPHIPVHLGSLGLCVRAVCKAVEMKPGDVIVTNHPAFGGSHLPDITVITPIFLSESSDAELIGYAVNRAHHAEIGGTRPGSMPPDATTLLEEGVILAPMHLLHQGEVRFDDVERMLRGATYPSRSVGENLADLRAQVAANRRGALAMRSLAAALGLERMQEMCERIGSRAEAIARNSLTKQLPAQCSAIEHLDDGTTLAVTIDNRGESAGDRPIRIDFTGTSLQHPGNLNATPAITTSAVLYVLRLVVGERLPMTEAILRCVELIIPDGILSPSFPEDDAQCPAVVGGNVETSQRIVDTLIKALGIMACGQGTMNNTLFGNERFGYYETVCGGAGAGPKCAGASAVHTHMTNTRITDVEILEHRYPVRVRRFGIRHGSGGEGASRGGDGVIRELQFLEPVSLSLLSQHRTQQPFGVAGGEQGEAGEQWIERADGTRDLLGGVGGTQCQAGDVFVLKTPGGGGYGRK